MVAELAITVRMAANIIQRQQVSLTQSLGIWLITGISYEAGRRCGTMGGGRDRKHHLHELKLSIHDTTSPAMIFSVLRRCRFCKAFMYVAVAIGVRADLVGKALATKVYPAGVWHGREGHSSIPDDPGGHSAPVGTTLTIASGSTASTAATWYTAIPETVRGEDDLICNWIAPVCVATDDWIGSEFPLYSCSENGWWTERAMPVTLDHAHLSLLAATILLVGPPVAEEITLKEDRPTGNA